MTSTRDTNSTRLDELPAPREAHADSSTSQDGWLVRSRAELDTMFAEVLAARRSIAGRPAHDSTVRRMNGVAAAVGWVLGKTVRSPVTDNVAYRITPAHDAASVRYEIGLARVHARLADDVGDRAYLDGVVDALSWTTGDMTQPPC